jgi:peptidoglycan-associated lipoprotein
MLRKAGAFWVLLVVFAALAVPACKVTYPKCGNDKDCHEHEYCVNGQCQQCRNDGDCPNGTCNQGRCEAKSQMSVACTDDTQCPSGQSCIGGACKPCRADAECGEGGKCNQGRCDRASGGSGTGGPDTSGPVCTMEPIYFDFNENVLSTEATSAIDRDADCVKKLKNPAIVLTGHTDPRGTEEYNLALSDRRSQAVRDRLQRIGANPASVRLVPKGELEASGTDESGWAKDRRVDFTTK